MYCNFSRW